MALTWAAALLIVGAVLVLAYILGTEKEKRKGIATFGVIVLAIGLLSYAGFFPGLTKSITPPGAPAPAPSPPAAAPPELCAVEDTTVRLSAFDKYSRGTILSDEWHRVFVNGFDLGLIKNGDTFTASPKDKLRIIFGENSTSYYSKEIEKTVPCVGTLDISEGLGKYDDSPTITIWLEDGSVMSSTNPQAMTADTDYTLPFRIRASNDKDVGNTNHPGKGNVWCVQADQTVFDKFEVKDSTQAPVPRALTAVAGKEEWCWYVKPVGDNEYVDLTMIVDTASTEPTTAHNATYYLYDVDIDLNADTLETINDVQDEDFNDLGKSGPIATGTIYVS